VLLFLKGSLCSRSVRLGGCWKKKGTDSLLNAAANDVFEAEMEKRMHKRRGDAPMAAVGCSRG